MTAMRDISTTRLDLYEPKRPPLAPTLPPLVRRALLTRARAVHAHLRASFPLLIVATVLSLLSAALAAWAACSVNQVCARYCQRCLGALLRC